MAKRERVYELKEPVEFGEDTITEVTISRKLKFLRNHSLKAGIGQDREVTVHIEFGTILDLAAKMIAQPPAVLEEMGDDDRSEIMGEAQDFLFNALGTGSSQSA